MDNVIGELIFEVHIPGKDFPAVATISEGVVPLTAVEVEKAQWKMFATYDDSRHEFILWSQVGDVAPTMSGTFKHGKAMVKYAWETAKKTFGSGVAPLVDSLSRLATRAAGSVKPSCFGEPFRAERDCTRCPYRSACSQKHYSGVSVSDPFESVTKEDIDKLNQEPLPEVNEDNDGDLLKRIQQKLADKQWEN